MVHSGSVDGQPSFAAESVVDGQLDESSGGERLHQHFGQDLAQTIEQPSRLTEEAMIAAVMSPPGATARPYQFGDETATMGQNPSRHQAHENLIRRRRENASELG